MKIAIGGAGLVGPYLYRLLKRAGLGEVTIFDKPESPKTRCGISPCAWGATAGFEELVGGVGLEAADYVLRSFDSMMMNGVKVAARAMVIDKPRLVADLLAGVEVRRTPIEPGEFDRIIDATGWERAFLPAAENDVVSSCAQYRISSREEHEISIEVSNLGYAWRFPMSGGEYHVGAGSVKTEPRRMLEKLGWLENVTVTCGCTGRIRISAPHFSLPFVDAVNHGSCSVWGVGEAIGCVAPMAGEGIIPGLKSARLLLANWEDPEAYRRAVLKEFAWMKGERRVVDKVVRGKRIGLLDILVLRASTERFGISLGYRLGSALLKSAAELW